ncbi:hypothetical protein D3C80_1884760 [compost metagenome]
MFTDGHQQRAVAGFLLGSGDVRLAVEQDVLIGRQATYHYAGLAQSLSINRLVAVDQLLDLTADQVFLVRPELDLPGAVAFSQRADQ